MNTNIINIIALLLGSLSYAFVILLIFRILRVNYFNPIVKIFVKLLTPITIVFTSIVGKVFGILFAAILFKFLSFYISANSPIEISDLIVYAVFGIGKHAFISGVLSSISQVLLFAVIGGVILSWVSPNNSHPLLELIDDISNKILSPIRNYIPSMGGLDFSPLLVLILLNQIDLILFQILGVLL
tara:strand:+ start:332 stop:886 length:555 start_codon:yes stop_codon:yes gene_type:complete